MLKNLEQNNPQESILYNNILLLSRNKVFYTTFNLEDSFQNRIYLIFMHVSFLFIKMKDSRREDEYKIYFQRLFDLIFNNIELNMREIGYGDTQVNKKMKYLIKTFYNILFNCENLKTKTLKSKNHFFFKYLSENRDQKNPSNLALINYFNKYEAFCFDLTPDSVLKGELNFKYKHID